MITDVKKTNNFKRKKTEIITEFSAYNKGTFVHSTTHNRWDGKEETTTTSARAQIL